MCIKQHILYIHIHSKISPLILFTKFPDMKFNPTLCSWIDNVLYMGIEFPQRQNSSIQSIMCKFTFHHNSFKAFKYVDAQRHHQSQRGQQWDLVWSCTMVQKQQPPTIQIRKTWKYIRSSGDKKNKAPVHQEKPQQWLYSHMQLKKVSHYINTCCSMSVTLSSKAPSHQLPWLEGWTPH